jgi:membrane associated rhomboid family serine protease
MIPLTVDVPMKRLPGANWLLIAATVWISLAVPCVHRERDALIPELPSLEKLSPLVLQRAHFSPYQLITHLFQHADLIHLFGNMVFLFVFGNAVNAKLGQLGFLAAYLLLGVLSGLAWLVSGQGDALLGASGAIMGACGMFLVLYPLNMVRVFWDDFELSVFLRSWTGELPCWVLVGLYLAFDVWGLVANRSGGIAYVSHVVGLLSGVALAMTLLKAEWLTPDRGEQTLLQWLAGEGSVETAESASPSARKQPPPSPLESRGVPPSGRRRLKWFRHLPGSSQTGSRSASPSTSFCIARQHSTSVGPSSGYSVSRLPRRRAASRQRLPSNSSSACS